MVRWTGLAPWEFEFLFLRSVAYLGFDWLDAGSNVWDASTIHADALASFLAAGDPPATHPSAFVGGGEP